MRSSEEKREWNFSWIKLEPKFIIIIIINLYLYTKSYHFYMVFLGIVCKIKLKYSKARFRRRTFHEPNLIHWIKYMKSSVSESIRNACFNLERISRSFRLAGPGISPLDRLWNAFDSDAEIFMYRTKCRNSYNVFCKQFDRNAHFSPSEFSSAGIKIGVWITLAGLNNFGRP